MRVHDGKYCYPGLRFVHSSKKIDINCPKHGIFQQRPQKHLAGQGYPKCKTALMPQTQAQSRESFIAKAQEKAKQRAIIFHVRADDTVRSEQDFERWVASLRQQWGREPLTFF
jgi:hypothetical protein